MDTKISETQKNEEFSSETPNMVYQESIVETGENHHLSGEKGSNRVMPSRRSDHVDDPRNWPLWGRAWVAFLVSAMGFMAQVGSSLINPCYTIMAEDMNISVEQASYCTTVFMLFSGFVPMLIVPFSNIYGRRNLYLICTVIAAAANIGSGAAKSYGAVIVGRVFYGIGGGIPLGIGAATICDLFPQSERGFYMGIYTLCVNNGPHLAPIAGGYIALNLSWRWCWYIPGIIQAGFVVILFFTFPETLFSRTDFSRLEKTSYLKKLFFHGKVLSGRSVVFPKDFLAPYRMCKYVAVSLPAVYWATANTYGSALFALTGSRIAAVQYDFNVAQTGLLMGIPLTIGCMIGETSAGWVSDWALNAYARQHNGVRKPEIRLALLPGCLLLLAGVFPYGPLVQEKKPWINLAICMGVTGVGVQMAATMVYTYTTDCYKPQSAEVAAIINAYKSSEFYPGNALLFAFTIGFYAVPFGETAGWNVSFPVLGTVNGLFLLGIVYLWFNGEKIRMKQGPPHMHDDL
ncbi:hypothetical protein N7510_009455 [Penicillium lagena]|uniref:uncharacterized protein n=1 Tax=Penicillium lagena TaxID=94218 RepID=UPI002540D8B2|nr:uncharacterized protein N7510_009455 [Penicillium lagena]KAJ5606674.1 hypothetical protein N7510_009455 [Penicillium lagena]